MDKIKSWIRWQWQHLQLRLIWYQLDKEGRLEWLREARYIYWRQQAIKAGKISPQHRKINKPGD